MKINKFIELFEKNKKINTVDIVLISLLKEYEIKLPDINIDFIDFFSSPNEYVTNTLSMNINAAFFVLITESDTF